MQKEKGDVRVTLLMLEAFTQARVLELPKIKIIDYIFYYLLSGNNFLEEKQEIKGRV